jgi:NTP pyrophosphatase (non-canonical NTP hydrolase)
MGRQAVDDLALADLLDRLATRMRKDSERWVPGWHGPDAVVPLHVAYGLGLAGEAGEVANVVKKSIRDLDGFEGEGLGPELADVFTYLLLLAQDQEIDLVQEYLAKRAKNEERWGRPASGKITAMEVFDPDGRLVYRKGYADRPDVGTWEDVLRGCSP